MKKLTIIICAALLAGQVWAQDATTVYVSGETSRRDSGGVSRALKFGDSLRAGDSIITKKTGRAELELPNKSKITVRPDTVFSIGEAQLGAAKQPVLTTSAGSVAFSLNKFTGTAPVIRSTSAVAGVRGTELEIFAGMDGSTLIAVTEGEVELSAQGQSVSLAANEAVEVQPGKTPGQKFTWLGREQDFSAWNDSKTVEFLKDPVEGVRRVEQQLAQFRDEMEKLLPDYKNLKGESEKTSAEFQRLLSSGNELEARKIQNYLINDLNPRWTTLLLNIRYYALSYLSMRRYVLGGMYVEMKSRNILKQDEPVFQDFLRIYREILSNYEEKIVPQLVEADI
jgi:hypothetical protein